MSLEDRFEIESPIHIGQIASAYPAVQRGLDRKILLKVLHQQWIRDDELVERFIREGKAIARIDHPNVVKVFECGTEDGIPYLAIEWIDCQTLTELMSGGPLPSDRVRFIAEAILDGLQAVHQEGIIHRDLKPDNILIGNDGKVYLSDFSLTGFESQTGLTEHGAVIGSPAYMAPELIEGEPASPQSDLFGVGVILFEALTGSNPFASDDPLLSLDKIRNVTPASLKEKGEFDPGLTDLIDALLERNPLNRVDSSAEALKILREDSVDAVTLISQMNNEMSGSESSSSRNRIIWFGLSVAAAILIVSLVLFNHPQETEISGGQPSILEMASGESQVQSPDPGSLKPTESMDEERLAVVKPVEIAPQIELNSPDKEKQAFLTLIIRPWAKVWIDGNDVGVSPLGTIELPEGRHTLRLVHSDYPVYKREFDLIAGVHDTLSVDLERETGRITITAIPWGYLWIDADSIGLLPRKNPLKVSSGFHYLKISHPHLPTWSDSIMAAPGENLNLRIDLKNGTMIANGIKWEDL